MPGFTINTVTISGNLTRDPELRSLPSGASVCSIRIASNERYKDSTTNEWSDRPGYYDVTIWKGIGEWVANNVGKGDTIVVEGRLRWREWEDQNGNKRQAVDITANSIVPVPRTDGAPRPQRAAEPEVPIDTGDLQPQTAAAAPSAADDDIPF